MAKKNTKEVTKKNKKELEQGLEENEEIDELEDDDDNFDDMDDADSSEEDDEDPFADLETPTKENKKAKKSSKTTTSKKPSKPKPKTPTVTEYKFAMDMPVVLNYIPVYTFKKGETIKVDNNHIMDSIRNILKTKGIAQAEDTVNYALIQDIVTVLDTEAYQRGEMKTIKTSGFEFKIQERHTKG